MPAPTAAPGALRSATELFANDAPKSLFKRLLGPVHMLAQDFVDESLVVAAARELDLLAEPDKNVVIKADGDPCFSSRDPNDGTAPGFAEIVFTLHGVLNIGSFLWAWPGALKSAAHCPRATRRLQPISGQSH